jgi:hypothetical protein
MYIDASMGPVVTLLRPVSNERTHRAYDVPNHVILTLFSLSNMYTLNVLYQVMFFASHLALSTLTKLGETSHNIQ